MVKSKKHIEIVRSTSKDLNSLSEESCDAIVGVLAKHFTKVGVTHVNNLADLDTLVAARPDLVFLGMEFVPSDLALGPADANKIWLSDVLDSHNIAYTGSNRAAHELQRDKALAKQRVLDANLATSAFCVVEQHQLLREKDVHLDFPLFIKPSNRGGGVGIDSNSVAHTFEQVRSKVHSITVGLQSDALIEEYLPGREFSVAILKEEFLPGFLVLPIELIAPPDENGSRLLSGRVKSLNAEQALEITDPIIKSKVAAMALAVFHALGARDYGRIDIRLDAASMPQFLEANLIPSLISGYGSFPKACVLNAGLEYEPMIVQIAKLGLARSRRDIADVSEPIALGIFPSTAIAFKPA